MLVQSCVGCHGPKLQEAGLRLDSRADMLKGIEGHPVVVPGHPEHSLLMNVTNYAGDVQMPPKGKLSDRELAVLTKWIQLGAPWPEEKSDKVAMAGAAAGLEARFSTARTEHWAFQPVKRLAPPEVKNPGWCRTPVDRFVLTKLEQAGLKPSTEADRRTLLRRVTLDLTGLPPSYEDVQAFENDKAPDAYARAVDRLLASPAYGERWARHWLDLARYADTKGYVFTNASQYPYAWVYRDYVVRAFNDDKPYDRFVVEQLAADKLPATPGNESLAAMGFLTVGRRFDNSQHDILDDRIDVITRGLLGLTVACCRCHDHKYDALTQDDYYSLYGILASSYEPEDLPIVGQVTDTPEYRAFVEQTAQIEAEVNDYRDKRRAEYELELRTHVGDYLAELYLAREKGAGRPATLDYPFAHKERRNPVVQLWRRYLDVPTVRQGGVFALWHEFASVPAADFAPRAAKIVERVTHEADAPIAGKPASKPRTNKLLAEALRASPPKSIVDVIRIYDQLFVKIDTEWQEAVAAGAKANRAAEHLTDAAAEELRVALLGPDAPGTVTDAEVAGLLNQAQSGEFQRLKAKLNDLELKSPGAPTRAMVLNDLERPYNPHVFTRGNPGRPGKAVPRQFIRLLAGDKQQPFKNGSGRLELAEAIVSPNNPLTARVLVNRVWQQHFGAGMVRTPSDFGIRAELPSHPELLDYLTSRFVEEGWSIKKLHRAIVLSSTYRQSSAERPDGLSADPENRLLWRMNRRRLELEAVRDSIFAVADDLDRRVGGRPVELWKAPYPTRRTIYGLIDRQDLPETFRIFDFASPDVSIEQRSRTTVPQQALFAMNSPLMLEQARKLAALTANEPPETRVRLMFRQVLAREPVADELRWALDFVSREKSAAPPKVPAESVVTVKTADKKSTEPAKPAAKAPAQKKQAAKSPKRPVAEVLEPWELLAHVMLMTNELVFID